MRVPALGCLAFLALTQAYAPATQTVSGTILDASRAALTGVTVTIEPSDAVKRSTVTDARGVFRFAGVPVGRATITAALSGFKTETRGVEISSERAFTTTIVLSAASAEESASVAAERPAAAPSPVSGGGRGIGTGTGIGPGSGGGTVGGMVGYAGANVGGVARLSDSSAAPVVRIPPALWNTEAYDRIEDNAFHRPADRPLSTFSIDVDTASYANVRRFLTGGQIPPADAVRIEELINYFAFDYPQPQKNEPFSMTTEVAACPWNTGHRVALVGLHTRAIDAAATPPRNLVFLIDVSGSMMPPDKLPLVKTALRMLADTLTARDRIAIVVYAGASGLVLPATEGDRKERIHRAIEDLGAGGSTNGAAGIQLAYDTAAAHFVKGGINRVILATDGDFNVGVTSQGELIRLIEQERERGIFLSVLGVGTGNLKDSTMEKLADKGNGNYAYLDSLHEARRVLIAQAGATLVTMAKDVKIQIEFNPATVGAYRLIGYENRILQKEDFNNDKKDAGEMGAGQAVTALYEIVPAGIAIDVPPVDPLKYQQSQAAARNTDELMTVKIRYKEPDGDSSRLMTTLVRNRTVMPTPRLGFASAVAEFGMLLRGSEHKGSATWQNAVDLARRYRGDDPDGYRAEFVRLVELASALSSQTNTTARR